jgi:hypothetical protein
MSFRSHAEHCSLLRADTSTPQLWHFLYAIDLA